MVPELDDLKYLRYSICVSGAAGGKTVAPEHDAAMAIGGAIAKSGHILTTGATVGLPYFAALGAKEKGGMSVGFSPAHSMLEHVRKYRLPYDVFDFINFTGLHYIGRDMYLVQSSDAVITIGGRFGSLHEFTSALEAGKPCGVLLGSGGLADTIPKLMETLELKPFEVNAVVYDTDPERLVQKIIKVLDEKYAEIHDEFKYHNHHWFLRENTKLPTPRAG